MGRNQSSYYSKPLERIHRDFHGICALCGGYVELKDASRDHIIPRAAGGGNGRDNIQLTHKTCNNRKGDTLYPKDWQEQLKRAMIIPEGYYCTYCSLEIVKWHKKHNLVTQMIRNGRIIAVHTWCNEENIKYGSI
jgi:hypothetical protein